MASNGPLGWKNGMRPRRRKPSSNLASDMNQKENLEFNRRDFLKSGSVATLMSMLGGVEILAAEEASKEPPITGKVKVALIGLGTWGREILGSLAQLPQADVAAICD